MLNKLIRNKDRHEVYVVYDSLKTIIYVGSGKENRHKHCKSGCSHVYELNRMHFSGEEVNVERLRTGASKEESLNIEKFLIALHAPKLNKQHTGNDDRKAKMNEARLKKDIIIETIKSLEVGFCIVLRRFEFQVLKLLGSNGINSVEKGIRVKSDVLKLLRGLPENLKRQEYFNAIFTYSEGVLRFNDKMIEKLNDRTNTTQIDN